MGSLEHYANILGCQGLMIPPFSNMSILDKLATIIQGAGIEKDGQLAEILFEVYTPANLAAMVVSRYSQTPVISEYAVTISEAIEAHILGLDHVAVAGLMPVIEGVVVRLSLLNGISAKKSAKGKFTALVSCAIEKNNQKKVGDFQQVESMLKAFLVFLVDYFWEDSSSYPLPDKTNRNGILHGAYADKDYGYPINFYKVLSALDMLCWISRFGPFPPESSFESEALALYYMSMKKIRSEVRSGCNELFSGAPSAS